VGEFDGYRKCKSVTALILKDLPVECGADAPLDLLTVELDERRGPHRPSEETVPQLVGGRDVVIEPDRVDLHVDQSAAFQQTSELVVVSEPEKRRPGG
jgi:hypothetical protein